MLQISRRCLRGKLVVLEHCSSSSSNNNNMYRSSRLLPIAVVTAETWIHNLQTCLWNTAIPVQGVTLSLAFAFKIPLFQHLVLWALQNLLPPLCYSLWLLVASREEQHRWTRNLIPWWIKLERLITVDQVFSCFRMCTWRSSLAPVHCWCLTSRRCLGSVCRLMAFMDPCISLKLEH